MSTVTERLVVPVPPPEKARIWHIYHRWVRTGEHAVPGDVALCGHVKTGGTGVRIGVLAPDSCVVCRDLYRGLP